MLGSVLRIQLEYHYIPKFFIRPLSEMLLLLEEEGFHTFIQTATLPHQIIDRDVTHTYMIFAWR